MIERQVFFIFHRKTVLYFKFLFYMFLQWIATGALRLPDGPKKPLSLKPVERKPLESVVRYLGKKKPITCCLFSLSFYFQLVQTGCGFGNG